MAPAADAKATDAKAAEAKAAEAKAGEGAKEKKEGDAEPSGPIKRPTEPSAPADAEELKVVPDDDGKIEFQFSGKKWQAVLELLADWSALTLDWTELPGDFVNITTRRKYSVEEARSIFNRMLLDRGYTLLVRGDILSVEKLEGLDAGRVPRVAPDQLAERDPYEVVKVSFPLTSLIAEKSVEELAPMKTAHGKLTALKATNRIEALDVVVNLQQIHALLLEEQSSDIQERLTEKFQLQYIRAEDAVQQLQALLGEDSEPQGQ